jgi:hypothetical protein
VGPGTLGIVALCYDPIFFAVHVGVLALPLRLR